MKTWFPDFKRGKGGTWPLQIFNLRHECRTLIHFSQYFSGRPKKIEEPQNSNRGIGPLALIPYMRQSENMKPQVATIDCYLTITAPRAGLIVDFEQAHQRMRTAQLANVFARIVRMLSPDGQSAHISFRQNFYNLKRYFGQKENSVTESICRAPKSYPMKGLVSIFAPMTDDYCLTPDSLNREGDYLYHPGDEVSEPSDESPFVTYLVPVVLHLESNLMRIIGEKDFLHNFKVCIQEYFKTESPFSEFFLETLDPNCFVIIDFTLSKTNLAASERLRRNWLGQSMRNDNV